MNVVNLQVYYHQLLSKMKVSGYSVSYINEFRKEIERILESSITMNWNCYGDLRRYYESIYRNSGTLRKMQKILRAIEQFDLYGIYPDGMPKGIPDRSSYAKLLPIFKQLIDNYAEVAEKSGIRTSTIKQTSSKAASLLFDLQELGFRQLEDITEEAITSVFISQKGKRLRGYYCKNAISRVINAYIPIKPNICVKVLSFLPTIRDTRKNIQYLTEAEVTKIHDVLNNEMNELTLRDKAIVTLAMYTGLRSGDIAALDISSIDWEHDKINIVQQKTGVPLVLPLTAVVGNAIYDYLRIERPRSDSPALFITQNIPFRRITNGVNTHISAKIMRFAGIRQSKGNRKGLHLFRHRVATTLVGNEVSQTVASHILGHSSPSSIESYLSADFVHLKSCALSISRFPVSEEVFRFE